jgi:large subunit ribosomal protein L24e
MDNNQCWFCGSTVYPGHGSVYIKNNCENLYFCRSKCKKLFKLGKNPSFLRWCYNFRKKKGKFIVLPQRKMFHQEQVFKEPGVYNNLLLKFMFFLMRRTKKQDIKKNMIYKNMIKSSNTKVV